MSQEVIFKVVGDSGKEKLLQLSTVQCQWISYISCCSFWMDSFIVFVLITAQLVVRVFLIGQYMHCLAFTPHHALW